MHLLVCTYKNKRVVGHFVEIVFFFFFSSATQNASYKYSIEYLPMAKKKKKKKKRTQQNFFFFCSTEMIHYLLTVPISTISQRTNLYTIYLARKSNFGISPLTYTHCSFTVRPYAMYICRYPLG